MPFQKGPVSARRYYVVGDIQSDWRSLFQDVLTKHAARSPSIDNTKEMTTFGAALCDNMIEVDFTDTTRFICEDYLFFSYRTDKLVTPKAEIKALTQRRVKEWCVEQGVERAPAAIKKNIKEQVEFDLRSKNRIKMQVCDVVWNTKTQELYFDSVSDAVNDGFRKWFYRAFGQRLVPRCLVSDQVRKDGDIQEGTMYPSCDFMLWLAYCAVLQGGATGVPDLLVAVDDKVCFIGGDGAKVSVRCDNALMAAETRRAISGDRQFEEVNLRFEESGEEYATLGFKGVLPDAIRVRHAGIIGSQDSDPRIVGVLLLEGVAEKMDAVAEQFYRMRDGTGDVEWTQVVRDLKAWAAGQE